MKNLHVFAFKGTIAEKFLKELKAPNKYLIESDQSSINNFIESLKDKEIDLLIGLGQYSGKDKIHLRIESSCTNKFRNTIFGDQLERIPLYTDIEIFPQAKITDGIGNSWCNLVSYLIKKRYPEMKYGFVHVVKKYDKQVNNGYFK